jgi:hypothetical protein
MVGLYYSQVFQQLQLGSINDSLSTIKQYLSEQSFYSGFTIQCAFQETPGSCLTYVSEMEWSCYELGCIFWIHIIVAAWNVKGCS